MSLNHIEDPHKLQIGAKTVDSGKNEFKNRQRESEQPQEEKQMNPLATNARRRRRRTPKAHSAGYIAAACFLLRKLLECLGVLSSLLIA